MQRQCLDCRAEWPQALRKPVSAIICPRCREEKVRRAAAWQQRLAATRLAAADDMVKRIDREAAAMTLEERAASAAKATEELFGGRT